MHLRALRVSILVYAVLTAYTMFQMHPHIQMLLYYTTKQLRIKGLKNIRIVDASIIPTLPGGQTGAVTVMIAEKASDIILLKK